LVDLVKGIPSLKVKAQKGHFDWFHLPNLAKTQDAIEGSSTKVQYANEPIHAEKQVIALFFQIVQ
jgi:hypothetical protein